MYRVRGLMVALVALATIAGCVDTRTEPADPPSSPSEDPELTPPEPPPPQPPHPSPEPPQPSPPPPATGGPTPEAETRRVTETEEIPFEEETVEDPELPEGVEEVVTEGVPGELTLTYEVTLVNGEEIDRRLVKETVTKEPVTKVVAIGAKVEDECDPNYTGCVPIASDVDCADGGGNGPEYVSGEVTVIGEDIYGLDRDGDGIGCEREER